MSSLSDSTNLLGLIIYISSTATCATVFYINQARRSWRDPIHQLKFALPSHGDNDIAKGLGQESSFAICEVILPGSALLCTTTADDACTYLPFSSKDLNALFVHLWMLSQQRWFDLDAEVLLKILFPEPQSLRIVATNVLDILDDQGSLRLLTDVVQELGDGGEISSREDVMVDKAGAISTGT